MFLNCFQVYTRSVIEPIPAASTGPDGDVASKAADRQKKKSKMTDEEIMDKLSEGKKHLHSILVAVCTLLISRMFH